MNFFRKLPGSIRTASGLEWLIWRKLPWITLVGTALPLLGLLALHLFSDPQISDAHDRWLQMANYMVAAIVIFHWTMVITVAIGCVIVMVMKGPGYVADGYRVPHRDAPRELTETAEEAAHYRTQDPPHAPTA
ncbi:MAG: hypothetical protein K9K38_14705 [Rhodoferax sp.]|nr:hypothetical protein [Rhodoferax sp.]